MAQNKALGAWNKLKRFIYSSGRSADKISKEDWQPMMDCIEEALQDGWQPIENAPEDEGTMVDLWCGDMRTRYFYCVYHKESNTWLDISADPVLRPTHYKLIDQPQGESA